MEKSNNLLKSKQIAMLLFALVMPFVTFAEERLKSAEEEAADQARIALYSEIGIAVLFIAAVTAFLVFKAKHDKKVREQQLEQMKKVQAAKRKAA